MSTRKTPAKKPAAVKPKGNILEYLEKLPSPYKEMAVYNYHKQKNFGGNLTQVVSNVNSAVTRAFEFAKTEQGFDFWDSVREAEYGGDYPEIPDATKTKTWSGIVPDYNIVVDKKKSIITVGCQEIDLDKFKQFVEEFNEFVE